MDIFDMFSGVIIVNEDGTSNAFLPPRATSSNGSPSASASDMSRDSGGDEPDLASEQLSDLDSDDGSTATDEEVPLGEFGKCSACGKKSKFRCESCSDAPSLADCTRTISGARYCSNKCQDEHHEEHNPICDRLQQRIQLEHVGRFLKELWLMFRRCACDLDVRSATLEGKQLKFVCGDETHQMSTRYVNPFPQELKKGQRVTDAILTYRGCSEVMVWLRPILQDLLKGQYATIQAIECYVRDPALTIAMHGRDGRMLTNNITCMHNVWQITLKSGEKWALDGTASQYGWRDTTMSWTQWTTERGRRVKPMHNEYANVDAFTDARFDRGGDLFVHYQWYELLDVGRILFEKLLPEVVMKHHAMNEPNNYHQALAMTFQDASQRTYIDRAKVICSELEKKFPRAIDEFYTTKGEQRRIDIVKLFLSKHGRCDVSDADAKEFAADTLKKAFTKVKLSKRQKTSIRMLEMTLGKPPSFNSDSESDIDDESGTPAAGADGF